MDCTKYQGPQPLLQSTDVHYYSKTGAAIFNWRVVYSRVAAPVNSCILQISAYDFRNIGESPFIGEVFFPFLILDAILCVCECINIYITHILMSLYMCDTPTNISNLLICMNGSKVASMRMASRRKNANLVHAPKCTARSAALLQSTRMKCRRFRQAELKVCDLLLTLSFRR